MTKICFSTPYKFGNYGDTTHIREVWEKVPVFLNGQVYIFTSNNEDLKFKNINIVKLNTNIFGVRIRYLSRISSYFSVIYKALKLSELSLVYERQSTMNVCGFFISKFRGIPLIYEVNSLLEHERKPSMLNNTITKISKFTEKFTVKQASKIIVVTPGLKEIFNKEYSIPLDKIKVIPNGANTKTFYPMDKSDCQKILGIKEDKKVVCFVGGLGFGCGAKDLVAAAPSIVKEVPNALFLIVGDGPYKETMQDEIKKSGLEKHFVFKGAVQHQKIPIHINSSDVCVAFYSIDDRVKKIGLSPVKLYEYMACGKPVVGIEGIRGVDIIIKNNFGLLAKSGDYQDISDKINKLLLETEENRVEMGKKGLKLVETNYNWEIIAKDVSEVCAGVTGKGGAP